MRGAAVIEPIFVLDGLVNRGNVRVLFKRRWEWQIRYPKALK
jgi:hypothetical protein